MSDFCTCEDYNSLKNNNRDLFKWHPPYGWVLSWVELTDEEGYTQTHRYGIVVKFCPMCGKEIDHANR